MSTTMTLADRYVRTDEGKAEIRARTLQLSRPARNLLMVLDDSCSGSDWVARVQGSTEDDLLALVDAGLVQPSWCNSAAAAFSHSYVQRVPVDQAVRDWSYDALYTLLTHEARERFGLIKGYRLILKIEGCTTLESMQAVALEFIEHLRKSHGEEAATRFRLQLGATE